MAKKIAESVAQIPEVKIWQQVHYVLSEGSENAGEHRPAIVSAVKDDGNIAMVVLIGDRDDFKIKAGTPGQMIGGLQVVTAAFLIDQAKFDAGGAPGTWHLPEAE